MDFAFNEFVNKTVHLDETEATSEAAAQFLEKLESELKVAEALILALDQVLLNVLEHIRSCFC